MLRIDFFFLSLFLKSIVVTFGETVETIKGNSFRESRGAYFQCDSNQYLQAPVFRSLLVYDEMECSRECLRKMKCFSFNVAVNSDQEKNSPTTRLCELLSSTKYYFQDKLTPRSSFRHCFTIRTIPARSCFDHLRKGAIRNGLYTIQDNPVVYRKNRMVYCDFTSEPGRAWTLIVSWKLANSNLQQFNREPFSTNAPVNDENPNWEAYRLPLGVMMSLKNQSTLWRATCNFPSIRNNTTLYRDYLRGNFREFDIFSFFGRGICKKVDYINIRGHVGISTDAKFWQRQGTYMLHIDSCRKDCSFKPNVGCSPSENNFGYYGEGKEVRNPEFRCTASNEATTNWWLGSE